MKFCEAVADGLHERLALRREDVLINLVEVAKKNWSFGNGEAQYCLMNFPTEISAERGSVARASRPSHST
jgi:hypothetical protein